MGAIIRYGRKSIRFRLTAAVARLSRVAVTCSLNDATSQHALIHFKSARILTQRIMRFARSEKPWIGNPTSHSAMLIGAAAPGSKRQGRRCGRKRGVEGLAWPFHGREAVIAAVIAAPHRRRPSRP
jgi:hypothetical protein